MSVSCPVCGVTDADGCVSKRGKPLRHWHAVRIRLSGGGYVRCSPVVPTWSDGIRDAVAAATALRGLATTGQSAQDVLDELLLMLRCSLETGQVCLRVHPPTSPADIPRSVPERPSK